MHFTQSQSQLGSRSKRCLQSFQTDYFIQCSRWLGFCKYQLASCSLSERCRYETKNNKWQLTTPHQEGDAAGGGEYDPALSGALCNTQCVWAIASPVDRGHECLEADLISWIWFAMLLGLLLVFPLQTQGCLNWCSWFLHTRTQGHVLLSHTSVPRSVEGTPTS